MSWPNGIMDSTIYTDNNGVNFITRDTGSSITYIRLDTLASYAPAAPYFLNSQMTLTGVTSTPDLNSQNTLTTTASTTDVYPGTQVSGQTYVDILNLNGLGTLTVQLSSLTSGMILQAYGSVDGIHFVGPLKYTTIYGSENTVIDGGTASYMQSVSGLFEFNAQNFTTFRVGVTVNPSSGGTATFVARANQASSVTNILNPVNIEGARDTKILSAYGYVPYATATDIIQITAGSIAKLAELKIRGLATGASWLPWQLIASTGQNTGGTPTSIYNSGSFDPYDGAISTTINAQTYAAAPTLVGTRTVLFNGRLYCPAIGTPNGDSEYTLSFERGFTKMPTLRYGYQLSISLLGNAIPAGLQLDINAKMISMQN